MTDRPRALAVLIAVFLVGCIIGSAGSFVWMKRPFGPFNSQARTGPQGGGPAQEHRRMVDFLQLTSEQEGRFREIMSESRKQLDQLRLEEAPKLEAIRAETNRKLKAILNQEQQNKFESFLKEMESRRRRGPGGRQFGPPMRPMQPTQPMQPTSEKR